MDTELPHLEGHRMFSKWCSINKCTDSVHLVFTHTVMISCPETSRAVPYGLYTTPLLVVQDVLGNCDYGVRPLSASCIRVEAWGVLDIQNQGEEKAHKISMPEGHGWSTITDIQDWYWLHSGHNRYKLQAGEYTKDIEQTTYFLRGRAGE